ncbi:MAG: hypothetical protein EXR70_12990 [Deltaproteobacteria bacterium]|nr:hypothetical protein [Deltaproteobacteria bacterium]
MFKAIITVAVVAALALPGVVLAQSTKRIDKRQDYQDQRIEKGVATGQLNQKEAARLEKGQQHVQKLEDKAMQDGKMTTKEKVRIEHAQDVQSKRIARQRHDKQKAK